MAKCVCQSTQEFDCKRTAHATVQNDMVVNLYCNEKRDPKHPPSLPITVTVYAKYDQYFFVKKYHNFLLSSQFPLEYISLSLNCFIAFKHIVIEGELAIYEHNG